MDSFIQITVFCPPEPRVGAFVHRNAGKVCVRSYNTLFAIILKKNQKVSSNQLNSENNGAVLLVKTAFKH